MGVNTTAIGAAIFAGKIFANARRRPIDLAAVVISMPTVTETLRAVEIARLMQLVSMRAGGSGQPRVSFTLQCVAVSDHWRIAGLSVAAS